MPSLLLPTVNDSCSFQSQVRHAHSHCKFIELWMVITVHQHRILWKNRLFLRYLLRSSHLWCRANFDLWKLLSVIIDLLWWHWIIELRILVILRGNLTVLLHLIILLLLLILLLISRGHHLLVVLGLSRLHLSHFIHHSLLIFFSFLLLLLFSPIFRKF